jgi:hypothetical protein
VTHNPKKQKIVAPLPKHGSHEKQPESSSLETSFEPQDTEDPLWSPDADYTVQPWENEDERNLRTEAEDPDAPQSL